MKLKHSLKCQKCLFFPYLDSTLSKISNGTKNGQKEVRMKKLLAKQIWRSKVGWETIFYFYQKWVYQHFAIIAKIWQSENFAGIAKIRYAIAKFTVPLCWILRLLFHWPLFPASCILYLATCYFFSYFLPALKFFIPGLLKLI